MPKPAEIVAALKDYRVKVVEDPGWTKRGAKTANGVLRPFTPYGQAVHHDAISEAVSDAQALRVMRDGRVDLAGPLCNGWIDSDSTVYLISAHNANHAGRNEADVHERMKLGLAPLGDARLDPDDDTVVGNQYLWGWECRNAGDGHDPWEQLVCMERSCAAIADVFGFSINAIAAHRELTSRKIDPAGIDMKKFRTDVKRIFAAHRPQGEDMGSSIVWYSDKAHNVHAYHVFSSGLGKHLSPDGLSLCEKLKVPSLNGAHSPFGKDWQDSVVLVDGPCKNV